MWACASLPVTSTSTGTASFQPGKRTRHQANHYARLRPPLAEERHSWGETPHPTHYPTRETVQTAGQSHARQTDHQRAPPHPDRARGLDRYSRAHPTEKAQTQEAGASGLSGSPQRHGIRQSGVFAVVQGPTACPYQLQSGALWFPGGQSRCRLHLAAVSEVRAYRRGEPPKQGVVVCLSEPSVRLYPAC